MSRKADVSVRHARREDLEEAARIFRESFTGSYRYWSLRLLDSLEVLVAELEGKIVGAEEVYVTNTPSRGLVGVISFIAVDAPYRRKGVGRSLVLVAENLFGSKGCLYATASTKSNNIASLSLFASLGYSLYRRGDPVFEELESPLYAYEDDVVMIKLLRKFRGEELGGKFTLASL